MEQVVRAITKNVPLIVAIADSFQDVMDDVEKAKRLLEENKGKCDLVVWTPLHSNSLAHVITELRERPYPTILVARDTFGQVLNNPFFVQAMINNAEDPRHLRIVVATQRLTIPPEIETKAFVVRYPLPDESSLKEILKMLAEKNKSLNLEIDKVNLETLVGLTREQATTAVLLSLKRSGDSIVVDESHIMDVKQQITRSHPALTLIPPNKIEPIKLYGYEPIMDFVKKSIFKKHRGKYLSMGIVFAGVPGNGKTTFAMQIARELGLPLLIFDPSLCFSPYVGESEQLMQRALDIIERMGRQNCIVLIDEVEKGLSFGGGDSGVSMRVFGKFLSWFSQTSEHRPFIIATSNEFSLPPEFYRRFDMIVFTDLPHATLRREIFNYYVNYYELPKEHYEGFDVASQTDGWTGGEIEKLVRFAKMLDIHVEEAMRYITPISKAKKEEIERMREYATKMQAFRIPLKEENSTELSILWGE